MNARHARTTMAAAAVLLVHIAAYAQAPAPPAGTLRIYLARHGQTDGNAQGRAQGWTDTPLNATGREQAQKIAAALKGAHLDAIYSSTLSRSRETAEIIAAGRPVISLPELREANLGKFEDTPIGDPALRTRKPGPDNPDHGESNQQFFERVSGGIKQILSKHPSGTILIVGHAGANLQILRMLLNPPADGPRMGTQGNDELYQIELDADGGRRIWKLVPMDKLNDL